MQALMFDDEIAIRVLKIDGSIWFMGLDLLQAAKIHNKDHARQYAELSTEDICLEPNPIRGRPRKLVSPTGAKKLLPDPKFIQWVDQLTGVNLKSRSSPRM